MTRIVSVSSFLLFLLWAILKSQIHAIELPTFHIDGAFQTASGLFRLFNGDFPGRDFFPYLGIGPILSLFPVFTLSGSNLYGSLFSAQLMTYLAGATAAFALVLFLACPTRPMKALLLSVVVTTLALMFDARLPGTAIFDLMANPGNSIRMIRAEIPYLVALIMFAIFRAGFHTKTRYGLLGIAAGFSLIWSNDYAYTTFFSFALCITVICVRTSGLRSLPNALLFLVTGISCGAVLLFLTTLGHPIEYLEYGFRDVAGDQWWYFGPYETFSRIFNAADIKKTLSPGVILALIILCLPLTLWVKRRDERYMLAFAIGLATCLSGLGASVGGHIWGYFEAFKLWALLTAISLFLLISIHLFPKPSETQRSAVLKIGSQLLVPFCLLLAVLNTSFEKVEIDSNLANNAEMIYVPELGGYLPSEWSDYVAFARNNRQKSTVEEYWGIFSAISQAKPIWPVDSVIHALGEKRQEAKEKLQDAEIIVTSRFAISPTWQPWSISQNYWFFNELLTSWHPVVFSPHTIAWERSGWPVHGEPAGCEVIDGKSAFKITGAEKGYYQVTLNYSVDNPDHSRVLVMVRNNISYASAAQGYVSLDPEKESANFPVLNEPGAEEKFDFRVIGAASVTAKMISCRAKSIPNASPDILSKGSPDVFYLTDENWINGISRRWPGFIVPNLDQFATAYKPGMLVRLGDGTERKILRVSGNYAVIIVFVDGEVLNPETAGIPSGFTVRHP